MTAASLLKRGFWKLPRSLTCNGFHLLKERTLAGSDLTGGDLLDVHTLLSEVRRELCINPVHRSRCAVGAGPILFDHDPGERLADLAPVAHGAVLIGHLEEVRELVLGGLALTADAE